MLRKSSYVIEIVLILSLLIISSPVTQSESINETRTLVVDPTNIFNEYMTISDAILSADNGDIIYVKAGVYHENIVINKSVSIISNDSKLTVINSLENVYSVLIKSSNVTLSGFTITDSIIGVYILGSNNTIENNIITNHTTAIFLEDSSEGNILMNNIITKNLEAITLYNSSYNTISKNYIFNNTHAGIKLWELSKNNKIENNTIAKSVNGIFLGRWSNFNKICYNNLLSELQENNGLILDYSYYNVIYNNTISNWSTGISLTNTHNNTIRDNIFENNYRGIYQKDSYEEKLYEYNFFIDNIIDIRPYVKPPVISAIVIIIAFLLLILFFILAKKKE
jgi:parallel beta-helix repeat protein